jgi:predicted glycosyltransferase
MKLILDILHPAHLNFFKNAIPELENHGIEVEIVYRRRGQLLPLLNQELSGRSFIEIGTHQKKTAGKFKALFTREYQMLKYLRSNKFDMTMGVAGFYIGFPARILGKPAVTFTDDWEYKTTFYLSKYSSDHLVIPGLIPAGGKGILKYPGYKELAYLHPKYYKPDPARVKAAGFQNGKFVFIRLVSSATLNYIKMISGDLSKLLKEIQDLGYDVVLFPEEAAQAEPYSKSCHILNPPVEDIQSWISYAALTITFGDTIARESCLLGTPSIYLGGRDMKVNTELISSGAMIKVDTPDEIAPAIRSCLKTGRKKEIKKMVENALSEGRWQDTTQVIVDICRGILEDNNKLINKYM